MITAITLPGKYTQGKLGLYSEPKIILQVYFGYKWKIPHRKYV